MRQTTDENQLRSAIFEKQDRAEEVVEVEEWDVEVLLRAFSARQRATYLAMRQDNTNAEFYQRTYWDTVQQCCCHPITRKQIFKAADRDSFMDEKDGAVVERLAMLILKLSKITNNDASQAKKNSESSENSTVTIDSQNGLAISI